MRGLYAKGLKAMTTPPARDDVVKRLLRFARDDEHWQLVWSNSAEMRADIREALSSLPAVDYCGWVETEPVVNRGGDDLVEHVAIALFECDGGSAASFHDDATTTRECYFALARAAIAALTTDDRAVR